MSLFRRGYTRKKEEDIFFINFSRKDSAQEKYLLKDCNFKFLKFEKILI